MPHTFLNWGILLPRALHKWVGPELYSVHWAIPEIRCTPPEEDMGIPKILTTFFIGKSQKISTFLVARAKKTWEFPKYSIIFSKKNLNSQFFTIFDIKNWGIPIF